MTQPISRRSLAAGLAAAPFARLPALAGAVSGDDPVLSALGALERLKADIKRLEAINSHACEAFEAARRAIGVVTFKGEEVYNFARLEYLANRPKPMSEEEVEEVVERLRRGAAKARDEAARPDPEYQAARAALEARLPDYEKAEAEAGQPEAEDDCQDAYEELGDTERSVFESRPNSRAGALALLRYAADFLDELGINDTKVNDVLPDAIRAAVDFLEGEART